MNVNKMVIDWQNPESEWSAHPSNHRLMPGGSEYESRYLWVQKQIEEGSFVLDVGCNCGQLAVNITQDRNCRVVGVDIVPDFIQHCNMEKSEFGEFHCLDFSRMDEGLFDKKGWWGQFDVVTALEVVEHPIDVRGFRDGVIRALRPGGRLIITTPHPDSFGYGYRYMRQHAHHVRMWSRWRLEQVFGPIKVYHRIKVKGQLNQIGAVFEK